MIQSHLDLSCFGFEHKKMKLHGLYVKSLPSGSTESQPFSCLVSYEFFKHVFHRSILSLLWRLLEVMVEVTINRLNSCSCTKRGVYTFAGVMPVYWLLKLLLFQIEKWESSSAFLLPLDFSKQVISFPFTCTELPKSSYFMMLIYFIILILKGSKLR